MCFNNIHLHTYLIPTSRIYISDLPNLFCTFNKSSASFPSIKKTHTSLQSTCFIFVMIHSGTKTFVSWSSSRISHFFERSVLFKFLCFASFVLCHCMWQEELIFFFRTVYSVTEKRVK